MKTFFTFLIAGLITSCAEKTQNVTDAGVEQLIIKTELTDKQNYTVTYNFSNVCEDLPENFDEVLQKLVEEARQNSFCRDN